MCMYKAGLLMMLQGLISFYMGCHGEEATHFGSAAALHDEDMVYAQYREAGPSALTPQTSPHTIPSHTLTRHCPQSHPHPTLSPVTPSPHTAHCAGVLLWRGFSLDQIVDQCFCNRNDPAHGRQMPVHYGSPDHCFQFISSPLATQMPQGACQHWLWSAASE